MIIPPLDVDTALSYVLALVVPALDAVLPVLPSETVVIALGVTTAGSTDPRLAALVALAAAGAFLGDNLAYLIGRGAGPWVDRRFFATPRRAQRREWAARTLARYGAPLIVVCRFIPGGRTVVTLTCGMTRLRHRTFLWATALAGSIWACYAFFLGRLGGKAFEGKPWIALGLALGISVVLSALVELARRLPPWWRRRRDRRVP